MTSYCKVPDINTEVRKQAGVTPHHNNTQGVDPSGQKCHLVHVQFHEFIVVAPRSSLPHSSASPPSSIGCLPSSGRGAVFSLLIPPTLVSETNSRNNRANTSSTSEIWVKAGIRHLHDDGIWLLLPECFEASYCIQYFLWRIARAWHKSALQRLRRNAFW